MPEINNICLLRMTANNDKRNLPNGYRYVATSGRVQEKELNAQTKHCSAKCEKHCSAMCEKEVKVNNSLQY